MLWCLQSFKYTEMKLYFRLEALSNILMIKDRSKSTDFLPIRYIKGGPMHKIDLGLSMYNYGRIHKIF